MTLIDRGEGPHDGTRFEVWKDHVRIECNGDLDDTSLVISRHGPKNTGRGVLADEGPHNTFRDQRGRMDRGIV